MNQDPLERELREYAWRRPLTAAEQARLDAWVAAHPEARADWEAEAALNAALARLPERPAPSNLTARVLAAIERDDFAGEAARKTIWFGWLGSWGWMPRTAVAVVVLAAGLLTYQHHQREVARVRAVRTLAAAANVTPLPSAEVLENLDAIRRLNLTPAADEELLALRGELLSLNR